MAKKTQPIDISQDSNYVLPKSIHGLENGELQAYYQYYFANEKDSPLSIQIDLILDDSEKDVLLSNMLSAINVSLDDFMFNSFLRNDITAIRSNKLSDTTISCDRIKGFFQINTKCNQHKLDCILKRIRDSFAHGRIATDGTYLILEDKTKELTGRLIITVEALELWKTEIIKMMQSKGVVQWAN